MTDSFVTQCPHCQTSFRVSHAQLSVARGVVRCGACLQIFNAAKQLLEQRAGKTAAEGNPVAPAPTPVPASPPTPTPKPTAPVTAPPVLPPIDSVAPAPIEPETEQDPWQITEMDLDSLDLDEELARLEKRENKHAEPYADKFDGEALTARRDQLRSEPDEWVGSLRNDDVADLPQLHAQEPSPEEDDEFDAPARAEAEPGGRTEPSLSLIADEPEQELDEHGRPLPPLPPPRKIVEKPSRWSAVDDDEDEHDDEPVLTTSRTRRGRNEPDVRQQTLLDLTDDPLQLDWQRPKPRWGRRLAWAFLCLLALAGLLGQYVWYHFDELARQDQYRPWFQQICPQIDCKVPSKVDITLLKSSNLVVRSHPEFKGALVVDAIIYNRAPFSQPFPLLELRFADTNGQLIASRRFKPGEYLSGEMAGKEEMPPQTPIHIALDILDPGAKAVNYSLSFRSPE
jgi:predicted Zn finger-like uncharacterized protein